MKRNILAAFALILCLCSCTEQPEYANRAEAIVAEINDPTSKKVLVVSHRGDWRNWPENSIPAIESVISAGADIVEIDVQMTADSVLVVCHDRTLDRTTNGKGRIGDITYDSLSTFVLKTGHGVGTIHRMPTLKEALEVCRDRIVVNIDKGYDYYDEVLAVTEELGVTGQVLIKGSRPVAEVAAKFAEHQENMLYMPVINILRPQGKALFEEYMSTGTVPLAYEICWDKMTPEVEECMAKVIESGSKLWVNTLWATLNGGLCDDAAFAGNPDEIYGKIVGMGTTMIQTDRTELLINYLRSKGLHD